jgi:hypothetical protein
MLTNGSSAEGASCLPPQCKTCRRLLQHRTTNKIRTTTAVSGSRPSQSRRHREATELNLVAKGTVAQIATVTIQQQEVKKLKMR